MVSTLLAEGLMGTKSKWMTFDLVWLCSQQDSRPGTNLLYIVAEEDRASRERVGVGQLGRSAEVAAAEAGEQAQSRASHVFFLASGLILFYSGQLHFTNGLAKSTS